MSQRGDKHSLPVLLRLADRPVILVGEGSVADAQRRLLERSGARIVEEGSKAALAIVVDDVGAVSRLKVRGALVYAVDRPDLCDFTPSVTADRGAAAVATRTRRVSAGLPDAAGRRARALLRATLGMFWTPLAGAMAAIARRLPTARRDRVALDVALARGGPLEPPAAETQPSAETRDDTD